MKISPRLLFVALAAGAASCSNESTAPSIVEIQTAQVTWASHNLARYAYRYTTSGFFNAFDGRAMRLVVLGDTVRSAQFVATNDSVPAVPSTLSTIDQLFALAISASRDGSLISVQFDPTFGYPTRIQLAGPPDASGSILASNIELLP